jgi:DNA-directed RNA polymerase subunit L
MEMKILKADKDDMEIEIDNLTVAEILRVYLNAQGVEFAAWRREHPSKPVIFKIKTSGKSVKKAVSEAVAAIESDCEAVLKVVKM